MGRMKTTVLCSQWTFTVGYRRSVVSRILDHYSSGSTSVNSTIEIVKLPTSIRIDYASAACRVNDGNYSPLLRATMQLPVT